MEHFYNLSSECNFPKHFLKVRLVVVSVSDAYWVKSTCDGARVKYSMPNLLC